MTARGFILAAAQSGAGKTTIATGLMRAFRERGLTVQGFKVGPDYVDLACHHVATGRPGQNVDLWLMDPATVRERFHRAASGSDLAIVEGVMGLFDGAEGEFGVASTAAIAKTLDLPVILVIDAAASGQSAAAIALGFKHYDPDLRLAGVIANRTASAYHAAMIEAGLAKVGLPLLGAVAHDPQLQVPEDDFGRLPFERLASWVDLAGRVAARDCRLDAVLACAGVAAGAPAATGAAPALPSERFAGLQIAVAHDEAFWFYYPDALQWLEAAGVTLRYFSTLDDASLPDAIDGILIGGGYPERYAPRLAANTSMLRSLRGAVAAGCPVYAEGGGFQYLLSTLTVDGETYPMSNCLPGSTKIASRLQAIGYRNARPAAPESALPACKGHVFHFGVSVVAAPAPPAWRFERADGSVEREDGVDTGQILASYLHVHFPTQPQLATAWLARCRRHRDARPG